MSTRRSRAPRTRKARTSEAPESQVLAVASASAGAEAARTKDPTQTSQLRALEAGWDELLA